MSKLKHKIITTQTHFRMKLHLIPLSGVTKYESKAVKGMEQRRTNIRPKTIPPGYKDTNLHSFMDGKKMFYAVKNIFQFSIINENSDFPDKLSELENGQIDLVAKQLYFNSFLLSMLSVTEEVGKTNNSIGINNNAYLQYAHNMLHYKFPTYDGQGPLEFAKDFCSAIEKVSHVQVSNPFFLIYIYETYNRGLFFTPIKNRKYTDQTGEEKTEIAQLAYTFEPSAACQIPQLILDFPYSYLASFYHEKGRLGTARVAIKAVMQSVRNRIETIGPINTQTGYTFTTNRVNERKIHVHLEIATTPANIADPYWIKYFSMPNSHFFDVTQFGNKEIIDSKDGKADLAQI